MPFMERTPLLIVIAAAVYRLMLEEERRADPLLERIRGENIIRLAVRPVGLLVERASHCKTFCNSPKLSKCGEASPLRRVANSTSLKLPEAKHIVRKILEGEKCRRFCLTI